MSGVWFAAPREVHGPALWDKSFSFDGRFAGANVLYKDCVFA